MMGAFGANSGTSLGPTAGGGAKDGTGREIPPWKFGAGGTAMMERRGA